MNSRTQAQRARPPLVRADRPDVVQMVAAMLRQGQVVGIPTDTVYGLAAAIDRPDAVDRLYQLKGRSVNKAIPILLAEPKDVELVADCVPPLAARLAARFWPGALTVVMPARSSLPDQVTTTGTDGERTVAVRVPNHPLSRAIIAAAGGALAVTSANRSGLAPCQTAEEVAALGEAAPDLVVDGSPAEGGTASTIVALVNEEIVVLREGAVSAAMIAATVDAATALTAKPGRAV